MGWVCLHTAFLIGLYGKISLFYGKTFRAVLLNGPYGKMSRFSRADRVIVHTQSKRLPVQENYLCSSGFT